MRTTLVLDDMLVKAAKRVAAATDATLSDVVNDALRLLVTKPARARRHLKLPTYGDPKKMRNVTPREIADALLADDRW